MHIKKNPTLYKFIYTALIFLALGLMTSPTIMAGYHILIVVPALILFVRLRKTIKLNISSFFLLSLGIWGFISAIYNLDHLVKPSKSFQELKYYFFGVLCIYPLVYFFSFGHKKHWKTLLQIFYSTVIAAFFVGILKAWGQIDIVHFKLGHGEFTDRSGGFYNYMRYGYASALILILSLGLNYIRRNLQEILPGKKLFFIGTALSAGAIITSQTRGALLGVLASLPFLTFKFERKVSKILLAVGGVFFVIVLFFTITQTSQYRFLNVYQGSNSVRLSQWQTALKVIEEKPLLGLGPDQFSYNAIPYKLKYDIPFEYYGSHAHNILLEHGAAYGIVGLIFLIGFFMTWFLELVRLKDDISWIFCSYIIGYFCSGQVELLFDVVNSHLLFFMYSLSQVYIHTKKKASL